MCITVNLMLERVISNFQCLLNENLVGVYLHGSAAMGCFNAEKSDIDLILVVETDITQRDMMQLKTILLDFDEAYSPISIEMSVVLKKYIENLIYPTPFLFHYSKFHREKYLNTPDYLVSNGVDHDLIAHFKMIVERGKCLYGQSIESYFPEIPRAYFIDAINRDRNCSLEEIIENPDYFILNACRFLMYLREEKHGSKLEGGKWALENLEFEVSETIEKAIKVYSGNDKEVSFELGEIQLFKNLLERKIGL